MDDPVKLLEEDAEVAHSSVEKVAAFAQLQAQQAGGDMIATAARAALPEMLRRLPQDPRVLDGELLRYAWLCLELRSDDAPRLSITDRDGQLVAPEL